MLTCCLVPNSSWQMGHGCPESCLALELYLTFSHSLDVSWGRGPGTRPNFSANDRGWGLGSSTHSSLSSLPAELAPVFLFDFKLEVCRGRHFLLGVCLEVVGGGGGMERES